MKKHDGDPSPYRTYTMPLPMADVRLIHRYKGREVILENMLLRASWNKRENKPLVKRYMPGLEEPLPDHRPKENEDYSNETAGPDDTLRITSEEVTFLPTLIQMPTPASVLDELRNKYSKFRIRHDDVYVEKMKKKEAEEQNKQSRVQLMQTPRGRLNKFVEAAAKAEFQRRINGPNTDAKIGEALWKHLTSAKQSQPTEEVRV
jgi:large subunit ribosomal protein L24